MPVLPLSAATSFATDTLRRPNHGRAHFVTTPSARRQILPQRLPESLGERAQNSRHAAEYRQNTPASAFQLDKLMRTVISPSL
jgi:hypothetical protein